MSAAGTCAVAKAANDSKTAALARRLTHKTDGIARSVNMSNPGDITRFAENSPL
jgi:hypothetical protein